MRRLCIPVLVVLLVETIAAQGVLILRGEERVGFKIYERTAVGTAYSSVRLGGLGPDLAGVADDGKTDVLFNSARLVRLEKNLVSSWFKNKQGGVNVVGLFPRLTPRIGLGYLLQGFHYRKSSGTPEQESIYLSGNRFYMRNSSQYGDRYDRSYVASLLGAYRVSLRSSMGLSYTYEPWFTSQTSNSYYLERRWGLVGTDSSVTERYRYQSYEEDAQIHRLRLSFLLTDDRDDWEFFGEYGMSDHDYSSLSAEESHSSGMSVYADTAYSEDTVHYYYRRTERRAESDHSDEADIEIDRKVLQLGGAYRRKGRTKMNILAYFGLMTEKLPGRGTKTTTGDEFESYFRVSDGDTSLDEREAIWDHTREEQVEGNAETIFGKIGVGVERSILGGQLRLVGGWVLNVERRIEETKERTHLVANGGLDTGHTNLLKSTVIAARVAIPIGIEWTVHPTATLRFGVTAEGIYEEGDLDGVKLYGESISIGESFGVGFSPIPDLVLDVHTLSPANIHSWTIEASLSF